MSRYLLLETKKKEIDEMLLTSLTVELTETYICHLGGGIYVTVDQKFPTVDIRHFWKPVGVDKVIPTRKGLALNKRKWERLCNVMKIMRDFLPELNEALICYYSHQNELEAFSCKECYPFENEEVVWKNEHAFANTTNCTKELYNATSDSNCSTILWHKTCMLVVKITFSSFTRVNCLKFI